MENEKLKTLNEEELRELNAPSPETQEGLLQVIQNLVERPHDYGTVVYAMSIAAVATYNYMAHMLGVSGFQASCADLDFIKRVRGLKDGFRITNYTNLLYPQYCNPEHFPTWRKLIKKNKEHLQKEAKRLLAENKPYAHSDVIEHWKWILSL